MYGERHQGFSCQLGNSPTQRAQWSNVLRARGCQVSDTWTDGDMLMVKLEMHKSLANANGGAGLPVCAAVTEN